MTPKIQTNKPIPYIPKSEQKPRRMKFKTIVKLSIVLVLIASLWGNYALLKARYNITCAAGGGLFPTKEQCHSIATMKDDLQLANAEIGRLEVTITNPDVFTNSN